MLSFFRLCCISTHSEKLLSDLLLTTISWSLQRLPLWSRQDRRKRFKGSSNLTRPKWWTPYKYFLYWNFAWFWMNLTNRITLLILGSTISYQLKPNWTWVWYTSSIYTYRIFSVESCVELRDRFILELLLLVLFYFQPVRNRLIIVSLIFLLIFHVK